MAECNVVVACAENICIDHIDSSYDVEVLADGVGFLS